MGQADMDIAPDAFVWRHVGPRPADIEDMLKTVGADSLRALVDQAVPDDIRQIKDFNVPLAQSEAELLDELGGLADQNHVFRSFIGMGYSDCAVPSVIQRNILENPGWYTQYTPYQSEISQGRLEALLNFQTMVSDLCGLDIANASMLDEATAAAEAMTMLQRVNPKNKSSRFFVGDLCHPQTIEVVQTRAAPLGIEVVVCAPEAFDFSDAFGCLVSYPSTDGRIADFSALAQKAHDHGALVVAATDLLALTLLKPPGEWGADVCVGNAQRFGVPLGYGGPHAAFFATRDAYKRQIPGRMVGVSVDKEGRAAFRLALQTREQHIRREKATSNICTAQVLLAIMSSMYAVYHGPDGLTRIAQRVHEKAITLRATLAAAGLRVGQDPLFDTVRVEVGDLDLDAIRARLVDAKLNVRLPHLFARSGTPQLSIALDELTTDDELRALAKALTGADQTLVTTAGGALSSTSFARSSGFLTHPIFSKFKSETEFLRYTHRLQAKDLSLTTSMIPLGSCTMKLNATSEMVPITWPGFSRVHPYAPDAQGRGYKALVESMGQLLTEITGHAGVSFQPNAGSQGEYTGLLVIRAYHASRGEAHRDVCLIPSSAHGTNPASATMAGMRVVVVKSDAQGNIDHDDLADKLAQHKDNLAAVMITYPSTHGVFEAGVRAICEQVHAAGGQVYLDGANMNAQVGLCRPGNYGADVLHLNLHKTFCIPHGGGGPGLGPITVAPHLKDFLPRSPLVEPKNDHQVGPVAAARYSSASILPIPWMYIRLLGSRGLRLATELAILNANYMKDRLKDHYEILFVGAHGRVAHEFIVNAKPFEACGIKVEDIAKRLMDYGFHAPTMSWPVPGTLMIEPTESESKEELDRFCDAMIHIRAEIRRVEDGTWPQDDNPLVNAPHTASSVTADAWDHAYTRQEAAYPAAWIVHSKFWPSVRRVDNVYGDRHVVCACPPLEDYQ